MKRTMLTFALALLCLAAMAQDSEFCARLKALDGVVSVQALPSGPFKEKYDVVVSQPLSHIDTAGARFGQHVIVGFRGYGNPSVLVTEGYSASYIKMPRYREEISEMLDANLVACEHRFYGGSVPDPCQWECLTEENSLADLHRVRQLMGKLFAGKWLSTGISKGGSSCAYYRAAYPDDVDASVAYVAPINRSLHDGRHKKFLSKQVADKEQRGKVRWVQGELMSRKERLVPMLDTFCVNRGLRFHIPADQLFDFEVLELEFSLWQWGHKVSDSPKNYDSDSDWFWYLVREVEPDYFCAGSEYIPFFYQAERELGYYTYDVKILGKNASLKSVKNYVKWVMLPENLRGPSFDPTLYKSTVKFLKQSDPTLIFIYGERDPWTASGVAGWLNCSKKKNMRVYVQPQGSHSARIGNMPAATKKEIIALLNRWMK